MASIGMSIVFECRNLHKRYVVGAGSCSASAHVLRGVDLALHAGDCVAIVGPRGAGKSTLLLCAAGLLRPDAGDVRWFGEPTPRACRASDRLSLDDRQLRRAAAPADDESIHLIDFAVARDAAPRPMDRDASSAWRRGHVRHARRIGRACAGVEVVFLRGGRLQPAARADAGRASPSRLRSSRRDYGRRVCAVRNASIIRTISAFVIGCHPCGFIGRPYSKVKSAFGLVSFGGRFFHAVDREIEIVVVHVADVDVHLAGERRTVLRQLRTRLSVRS